MASFFKGPRGGLIGRGRDSIIKEALTNNLSECVKAIQFNHQTEEYQHQIIGSNDLSNALCSAFEAMFLHGVKDTFFKKAKSAFSGDVDHKPEPSFWPLILLLSHRDNIEQVMSLQQINTEIGQCRAWVRMALNDCLLSSYISTILRNVNVSKSFYSHSAFIRDAELLDVAQRLLEGLESCTQFDLPINSSLFNSWPEDVLMLTGIWMPTMRADQVAPGVDVASTLSDIQPETKPQVAPYQSTTAYLGGKLAMDEDDALNYILSNISNDAAIALPKDDLPSVSNIPSASTSKASEQQDKKENILYDESKDEDNDFDSDDDAEPKTRPDLSTIGNSILTGKTGWSSDLNDDVKVSTASDSSNGSGFVKLSDSKSISSLVDADDSADSSNTFEKTSNLREVMRGLQKELKLTSDVLDAESTETAKNQVDLNDPTLASLGFEVVSKYVSTELETQELQKMLSRLGKLSREYGLDAQDYECCQCRDMLGTTVSKAKVCTYSGEYFCSDCMDPNVFMIPARVVHNWDFRRYSVSKKAALFLLEFQHQPLINIKKINPLIYAGVREMAHLQQLRIRLNFLRAYLFTCREPVIEELQKRVWPREYLYEHVHLYSVSDLAQISNGSLASQLEKVVIFALNHVQDCLLCSQKGFICEVCKNPKVLYPFDVDTTFRCDACSTVFHSKCLDSTKLCPKCERIKKRQGVSLVDAVHSHFT